MLNLLDAGTVGLSVGYLDYGDLEVTTLREPDGTGETFNPKDLVIGLTYAYNLTDRFSIGGSVKYINQRIWNTTASAVAIDIGTLFISDIYGLRIPEAQVVGQPVHVAHRLGIDFRYIWFEDRCNNYKFRY